MAQWVLLHKVIAIWVRNGLKPWNLDKIVANITTFYIKYFEINTRIYRVYLLLPPTKSCTFSTHSLLLSDTSWTKLQSCKVFNIEHRGISSVIRLNCLPTIHISCLVFKIIWDLAKCLYSTLVDRPCIPVPTYYTRFLHYSKDTQLMCENERDFQSKLRKIERYP